MTEPNLIEQFSKVRPGDLGIIGDPVEHSLSPQMHNPALKAWWARKGGDSKTAPTYHKFWVRPHQLQEALRLVQERKLLGVNVTVPYKEAVCQHVHELDDFSTKVRSVNTIKLVHDHLRGFNTDADGFEWALKKDLGFDPTHRTALVLGTGGTGSVLIQRLLELKVRRLFYWNRSQKKTLMIDGTAPHLIRLHTPEEIAKEIAKVDLIVNATSVGLSEGDPLPTQGLTFRTDQFVFDVIYNRETEFLKQAKASGANAAGGLSMLLYQGAKAFQIWTGTPASIDMMRKGLERQ